MYQTETSTYPIDSEGYLTAPCGCYSHDGEDGESTHGHPFCDENPAELVAAEERGEIVREYDQLQGWRWRKLSDQEVADRVDQQDQEEAATETRGKETERENELWDAGAASRYEDEVAQMARDDRSREVQDRA